MRAFSCRGLPGGAARTHRCFAKRLSELTDAPYRIRIIFLSRRSFAEWQPETLLLQGRFGKQELAVLKALTTEQCISLAEEAAVNVAKHMRSPVPDLGGASAWFASSQLHRIPLYATAAALHAVLSPTEAFGIGGAELLNQLALREQARVRKTSLALNLGVNGLERLLALGVLADGLNQQSIAELYGAGVCKDGTNSDPISSLANTPWWDAGRLIRLEPDLLAAAFLDRALFGPRFPQGRAELPDWMFIALRTNAATFGDRLARILYDLDSLHKKNGTHALDACLCRMIAKEPHRAAFFRHTVVKTLPFWAANFAAFVACTLARSTDDPIAKAMFVNNASNYLSMLGQREAALSACQDAVELYRELARARPETFTSDLAMSLNNLAAKLSEVGRREEALIAAQEAVQLRRELARAQSAAFTPALAGSLQNLAGALSRAGRPEDALAALQEAVAIRRELARMQPDVFTPELASSLTNLVNVLSTLERNEEALQAGQEAVAIRRELVQLSPEVYTPNLAASLNNLAHALLALGRTEDALNATREAVAIRRELARVQPEAFTPVLAGSLSNLTAMLGQSGLWEEALIAAQEAVDLQRQLIRTYPEEFTPDLAGSLANLANVLWELGRNAEALASIREALRMRRELASVRPEVFMVEVAKCLLTLFRMLSSLGRSAEAQDVRDELEALAKH